MAKRKKKSEKEKWTPGPVNPESGGGSTGKSRSKAEDDFREEYDRKQKKGGRPGKS